MKQTLKHNGNTARSSGTTCEAILGKKKTQHKEWISANTILKLETRRKNKTVLNNSWTRAAKAKAQEEYTAADREVKRSIKKDKRNYIDDLARQRQQLDRGTWGTCTWWPRSWWANSSRQTSQWRTRTGTHWQQPRNSWNDGQNTSGNCWTAHQLRQTLKGRDQEGHHDSEKWEGCRTSKIPAEAIRADIETAVNMLYSLFSKIWETEEVPAQRKEGIIIKLPKKGDLRDCSNYRGIMLLSAPGKVLNRVLLERMKEAVNPKLQDQQAGFRQNRSCASLRIIVEQSLEWNSPLYISFIDYEVFDSVDRETMWKLLRHYGVPKKIISLTYQDMNCKIAHAGQLSKSFKVKTRVRQGCLLSAFLFLLVFGWIMKTTATGRNNSIQWTLWTQLDDLDFADDLALLSHNHSQMQDRTTLLETTSAGTGLKINRKKAELMKMNTTANTPVTVGGEPIREVK